MPHSIWQVEYRKKRRRQDEEIDFATGNENKMKEIRMILADCGYEILSMKEAGIQADIVEDGKHLKKMPSSRQRRSVR